MTTLTRVPDLAGVRARRLRAPVVAAGSVGLASLALLLRDPHRHASWGLCPFKAVTGWDCPACGGLRAVNDLGHGQVVEAVHSNLLFVASLPLLLVLWAWWVQRSWTGADRPRVSPAAVRPLGIAVAVVVLGFWVFRNTPWGSAWYAS